jgi:hypothetical protein
VVGMAALIGEVARAVVSGDGEGILQLQEVSGVSFCGSVGLGAWQAGVAVASCGRRGEQRWRWELCVG